MSTLEKTIGVLQSFAGTLPADFDYKKELEEMREEKRAEESKQVLSQIQGMFSSDRYWDSEDAMIADMAAFRKERMGL